MPPWDNLITGPLSALMWATEPGRGGTEKLRGICSLHRGDAYPNTTTNSRGRAECGNGDGSGHGRVRLTEESPVKKRPSLRRQRAENNRRTYIQQQHSSLRAVRETACGFTHTLTGGVCSHWPLNWEIYLEQLFSRHNQTVNIKRVFHARQPCISDVTLVTHSGPTRSPMTSESNRWANVMQPTDNNNKSSLCTFQMMLSKKKVCKYLK